MQKNKKFLLPIITAVSILFSGYAPVMADVDLSTIPAYTGEPYVEINDNVPDFPEDDFTTDSFESYSDLDNLGRCGVAYAKIEYSNAIVHAFQGFRAPFSGKIVHIFPEQSAAFN